MLVTGNYWTMWRIPQVYWQETHQLRSSSLLNTGGPSGNYSTTLRILYVYWQETHQLRSSSLLNTGGPSGNYSTYVYWQETHQLRSSSLLNTGNYSTTWQIPYIYWQETHQLRSSSLLNTGGPSGTASTTSENTWTIRLASGSVGNSSLTAKYMTMTRSVVTHVLSHYYNYGCQCYCYW